MFFMDEEEKMGVGKNTRVNLKMRDCSFEKLRNVTKRYYGNAPYIYIYIRSFALPDYINRASELYCFDIDDTIRFAVMVRHDWLQHGISWRA